MAKNKGGRPTMYSLELTTKLCALLANGMSLRKVCERDDMPSIETVRQWLLDENKPEFLAQYARARDEQADFYADQIIEEADKATDKDSAAAAKVKVDARKWVASKLKPKKYGDKLDIDGRLDGNVTIQTINYAKVIDAESNDTPQISA